MFRSFVLLAILSGCVHLEAATPYPPPLAPEEIPAAIDSALAEATAEDKLAMLVLGANWCHDSTDFAAMIEAPEMRAWLQKSYVIALFNLGYMDSIQAYLATFDIPAIYGTPTVLVVDPQTRAVRNLDRHYLWRNASEMNAAEARDYFSAYLAMPAALPPQSAELSAAMARIDRFEEEQGQRIQRAYAKLSILLRQYDEGNPAEEFKAKWSNLAEMRSQITTDLAALRQSAIDQDAAGSTPITLDFPQYSLFSD